MASISGVRHSGNSYEMKDSLARAELEKKVSAPTGAVVGQTIIVTAVDATGVPTAWEPADVLREGENGNWWLGSTDFGITAGPQLGASEYELIADITLEEDVSEIEWDNLNLSRVFMDIYIGFVNADETVTTGYGARLGINGSFGTAAQNFGTFAQTADTDSYTVEYFGVGHIPMSIRTSTTARMNSRGVNATIRGDREFSTIHKVGLMTTGEGWSIAKGGRIIVYGVKEANYD